MFRAVLTVTDGLGPRLFFVLEVVLYVVYIGCFIRLVWLQIATDASREDASGPDALYAVCCIIIAAISLGECAQIRVFRKLEFEGVEQKIEALDEGFSDGAAPLSKAYHYGAGYFLSFLVLLAGIPVRARKAQSTSRFKSSVS